jgi:hypothetical protein
MDDTEQQPQDTAQDTSQDTAQDTSQDTAQDTAQDTVSATAPQDTSQDTSSDNSTTPVFDAIGIPEEAIARAFDEIRALLVGLENPTWMLEAAKQQLEMSATNVFRHIQQAV